MTWEIKLDKSHFKYEWIEQHIRFMGTRIECISLYKHKIVPEGETQYFIQGPTELMVLISRPLSKKARYGSYGPHTIKTDCLETAIELIEEIKEAILIG